MQSKAAARFTNMVQAFRHYGLSGNEISYGAFRKVLSKTFRITMSDAEYDALWHRFDA